MLGEGFSATLWRAQGGDEVAFALLFRDLQPRILRYLRVVAAGAHEDLASETWLEVVRGLSRFSGDERRFHAWVFTIARHRHLDRLRSLGRRPLEVPTQGLLADLGTPVNGADHDAEENLSTEAALRLIATLPAAQAEAIVLRAVAGLSVAEVARIVGRDPGTVRVSVHRGLRSLAQALVRDGTRNAVAG